MRAGKGYTPTETTRTPANESSDKTKRHEGSPVGIEDGTARRLAGDGLVENSREVIPSLERGVESRDRDDSWEERQM